MRIRSIHPEFWRSEDVVALDWPARLLFIGLWSYVDDNGVGRDVEKLIAAELFPLEDDPRATLATVSRGLQALCAGGQIARYTVDGKPYLYVTGWPTWQRIDRPGKERYPLPTSEDATPREPVATSSRATRDTPATGEGEKGRRGEGEKGARTRATQAPDQLDITDRMRAWAATAAPGVDLTRETARFLDHHRAKGSTFKDWTAAWRTWMSRSADYGSARTPLAVVPQPEDGFTAEQLNEILGPPPPLPQPPRGLDADGMWEWEQRTRKEQRADRVRRANEKLGRPA